VKQTKIWRAWNTVTYFSLVDELGLAGCHKVPLFQ